jgi:hypothetical protein
MDLMYAASMFVIVLEWIAAGTVTTHMIVDDLDVKLRYAWPAFFAWPLVVVCALVWGLYRFSRHIGRYVIERW